MSVAPADWLGELAASLQGPRRARRRLLAELEGHLEDAIADGLTEVDAIARLGPASDLARRWNADARRRGWEVRIQILAAALAVAAIAAPVGLAQRQSHTPNHGAKAKSSRPASSASRPRSPTPGRGR